VSILDFHRRLTILSRDASAAGKEGTTLEWEVLLPARQRAGKMNAKHRTARREIFVFTPEEKKAGACVLAAFLLGLATMHYRAGHPQVAKLSPKQEYAAKRQRRAVNAHARSARGQQTLAVARATPAPNESEEEEN